MAHHHDDLNPRTSTSTVFRPDCSGREETTPLRDHPAGLEGERTLDLNGRWVWRGRGGHAAHLIRERSTASSTPWTLCGRRLRQPRSAWRGVCPTCRSHAADLTTNAATNAAPDLTTRRSEDRTGHLAAHLTGTFEAEPAPARHTTDHARGA